MFSINVYDLLNPGATLFVKTLVAMNFDVLPDVQSKPFSVISSMGDSVIAKRDYKNHPTMLPNRVTHVDLIELDMIDFDVILGMDWLDACFAFIDCRTSVVNLNFPSELVLEWKGETQSLGVDLFCV